MYARPTLDGTAPTTFGVSGKLWRSSLVMYDRQTRSLWSQVNGTSIAGGSEGTELEQVVSSLTTWAEWRARHPDTLVLVKPPLERSPYASYHRADWVGLPWFRSRDRRLPAKTLVLGVEPPPGDTDAPATALDLRELAEVGAFEFPRSGERLLAVMATVIETPLLYRIPGESIARSQWTVGQDVIEERATGLRWDWRTGRALGATGATALEALPASPIYWGIWSRFHPETALALGGSNP